MQLHFILDQVQNLAKRLAHYIIRNYVTDHKTFFMSKKILYRRIFFQDSVFEEIHKLQNVLSQIDGKIWNTSNIVNLLLRFYFKDENNPICAELMPFLQSYMAEKESFLNAFVSDIMISSVSDRC